jgi:hypothetical protein
MPGKTLNDVSESIRIFEDSQWHGSKGYHSGLTKAALLVGQFPAAPDAVLISKSAIEAIIADANLKPTLFENCLCVGCKTWMPHGHPEAREHSEDCPEEARVNQLKNWQARLADLL